MKLEEKIEAVLFAGARPFSVKRLAELCEASSKDVEEALEKLEDRFEKTAIMGQLTRPSLEALTILAYRGPLTRPEIEQIRGVHSSIILRNLMMSGLVEEKEIG